MSPEPEHDLEKVKADCYSSGERAGMVLWQHVRAVTLRPLLVVLSRLGVRPDHLTLLSAVSGLSFCPLFFWAKPLALAMLALHVVLDGLDGPLARHTNTASRRGSFSDSMADQLVVVASTLTLMSVHVIGVLPGSVYVVAYTVVMLFAMVRNALSVPYSWLVRPRLFVYFWFLVETYYLPGTIDYVLWLFNAFLVVKMVTGFAEIRRSI
jgi:phosphatidylglycerophosphate synthase